jgi:hypothetical protein
MLVDDSEVDFDGKSGVASATALDKEVSPCVKNLILLANVNGIIEGEHMLLNLKQDLVLESIDGKQFEVLAFFIIQELPIIIMA